MKKSLNAMFAAVLLAASFIPATSSVSHARGSETVRINGEGFRKCKALGDSGYTAIVRGRSVYGGTNNGAFGSFNLRSCFETRAECSRFVGSVPYIVPGVFDIRYSSCKARG